MDRRFATILAVIVLIFVSVFVSTKNSNDKNGNASSTQPTNHVEGQNTKGVTLVEYGDYECPVCEAYYQPLKQTAAQFNTEIHFQFRNLPLSSIHPNAFAAARAAEAASMQNKFWEMHDMLYDSQTNWASSSAPQTMFTSFAKQLGLNVSQFTGDYSSQKVNDAINADLAAFKQTGQEMATPTFFLNGKYLANGNVSDPQTGQPSVDKFVAVIRAEIAKK
jgi:protein-disulfide isomerase